MARTSSELLSVQNHFTIQVLRQCHCAIVGAHPVTGGPLYTSTKGAIETLTRGLALELAPCEIRLTRIDYSRITGKPEVMPRASKPAGADL